MGMVYNIKDLVERVFFNVKARGYEYEIPLSVIAAEIKRETGIMNDNAVSRWLKNFEELGYIKPKAPGIVELCVDVNEPYNFRSGE